MTPQLWGLVIGGILPAIFYGVSSAFAKASTNAGMPVGIHLFWIGLAISATGVLFSYNSPTSALSLIPSIKGVAASSMLGILWGLGTGCVALGLIRYQAPLAKLVPLYNMNTLITVLLALILFAEWKDINGLQLFIGAGLIIAGGVLVSGA
ncbi:MAG: hypothetical protein F6K09_13945 [Merismopedia sp. SIO2A8]|nr:hypothetical protein [Symploca sp. SIO2B6]NET49787.1 hypothetical protein [Merismopedia sp. SIO2A8]